MTYLPDSVLVEKVAKALYVESEPDGFSKDDWRVLSEPTRDRFREYATAALSVACPLVAGVIADRLDEEAEGMKAAWDRASVNAVMFAASLVRAEYGEQT